MMLSNIFAKVVPLLKEKKFDIDYEVLAKFLERYKPGDWLYPDAMHRNLKMNIKTVYEILELCVDMNTLEQYLQIYCPNCQKYTGQYYKTIAEIPDEINCLHCDYEISNPLNHAIIIYKVL